ncbi:hypothetical protein LCGC14_0484990 [marine sediment metagenome]|uniref:Uncharacterized protein n=1 Tax=marine sediment metagenome TaxID=412755 RepID=A0A0F9UVC2_9ZZZZ
MPSKIIGTLFFHSIFICEAFKVETYERGHLTSVLKMVRQQTITFIPRRRGGGVSVRTETVKLPSGGTATIQTGRGRADRVRALIAADKARTAEIERVRVAEAEARAVQQKQVAEAKAAAERRSARDRVFVQAAVRRGQRPLTGAETVELLRRGATRRDIGRIDPSSFAGEDVRTQLFVGGERIFEGTQLQQDIRLFPPTPTPTAVPIVPTDISFLGEVTSKLRRQAEKQDVIIKGFRTELTTLKGKTDFGSIRRRVVIQRKIKEAQLVKATLPRTEKEVVITVAAAPVGALSRIGLSVGKLGVVKLATRLPRLRVLGRPAAVTVKVAEIGLGTAFVATSAERILVSEEPLIAAGGVFRELALFGGGLVAAGRLAPVKTAAAKTELEFALQRIGPAERSRAAELFKRAPRIAKEFPVSEPVLEAERLPPKAVTVLRKFLRQEEDVILGGSAVFPKRAGIIPEDIDLFVVGRDPKRVANLLASRLKKAGVERVSVPPGAKAQITIGGVKAIEIGRVSKLEANIRQVQPLFARIEQSIVTSPTGIRMLGLRTQLRRKVVGGLVDPTRVARGKARKDLFQFFEVERAAEITPRPGRGFGFDFKLSLGKRGEVRFPTLEFDSRAVFVRRGVRVPRRRAVVDEVSQIFKPTRGRQTVLLPSQLDVSRPSDQGLVVGVPSQQISFPSQEIVSPPSQPIIGFPSQEIVSPPSQPIIVPVSPPSQPPVSPPSQPLLFPPISPPSQPPIVPTREPPVSPPPRVPPSRFFFPGRVRKPQLKETFVPLVKEKGGKRFIRVSKKALPRNKAINLAADIVDQSTAASFKIRKAKRRTKAQDDFRPLLQNKFRQPVPKSKLRGKGILIEKNINRIDSVGERRGITAKGLMALRRKRARERDAGLFGGGGGFVF